MSSSTAHNIKRFGESGGIQRVLLAVCDLWVLRAALKTGMIHSWKSFHGLRNTSTNSSTKCRLKLYHLKKKPHVNRIHNILKAMNEKQMGMECVTRMDFLLLFTLLSRCLSQRVTPVQRELKDTLEYPAYL